MPNIAEIHTTSFTLPLRGILSWGKSSRLDVLNHVLVRLVLDSGHVGWAEAPPRPTIYGETSQSIQTIIQQHLAPYLIGLAADDFETINETLNVIANNHTAKGAIDIALHEAVAASKGQSLLDYLDPPQRRIKVSYILGLGSQEMMLSEAKLVYEQGVRVLKVKVGPNFATDVATIQAIHQEFSGADLSLYVDANECLLPHEAQAQLQTLAEQGILYVEEPLPKYLIQERANLRATETLPLIADDSVFTPNDLARELTYNTFDILNIKTARTGYTQSCQMLEAALAQGKGIMVGSQASSTLGTMRTALFAGLEGIDHPAELSFFLKVEADLVNQPLKLQAGYMDLESFRDIKIDEAQLRTFARS